MARRPTLFLTIVLDGVGIGAQPDAHEYGDEDSATLQHICDAVRPRLRHLQALGLGNIKPLSCVPPVNVPAASFGHMREVSPGKDSTTGHWELAGLIMERAFPTYPDGFPADVIGRFVDLTGCGGVLGNVPASGTKIIARLGEEHQRTGFPIVYTSADSVFQIAAHEETVPLERLYEMCVTAREEVCTGEHAVGRVIARPFVGEPGSYRRVSANRRDFSYLPPRPPVQQALQESGVETISVGKVSDLFGHVGFDRTEKTKSNAQGIETMIRLLRNYDAERPTFVWANLIDFDQEFGHRNDPEGFARALVEFDTALPELLAAMPDDGLALITADHGNDPTTPSTDHSREFVPLLMWERGRPARNLGMRASFADHAASVADYFGIAFDSGGESFLQPGSEIIQPSES